MVMPHQDTQLARGPGMTDFLKAAQGPAASSTPPCPFLQSMKYTLWPRLQRLRNVARPRDPILVVLSVPLDHGNMFGISKSYVRDRV